MSDERYTPSGPLIAVVILLVLSVAYVAAYYLVGGTATGNENGTIYRIYDRKWQVTLFTPAGAVETMVRGRKVEVVCFWD